MSADLSDPQILPVYSSIVRNDPTNWLLLTYGKTRDKLSLFSTGTGGIEELANHLTDDDVYFAFVREDKSYVIISYFPAGIPGVRRARAMVHSRAVTSLFKVAATTYAATTREQVGTNQVRAKLGLQPIAGIARGFMSQGPASLPANSESMPVYQNAAAAGRVGSPTTRADSPGGGRAPAGYNNARRTESPLVDSSRIPRPGQQQSRRPPPRNAYGHSQGQGQGLAPPPSNSGSRIGDAPSFEIDGKASYYAPGMQVDSRENSMYDPGSRGVYERSVRSTGGHIPSQDRDLPLPPLPSLDDDDEEEFEVIPGAEDVNGFPDIPTPTGPTPQSLASLIGSNSSPPPVPRKSTESYGKASARSSDSGLGLPRDSTDSMSTSTSGAGGGMQSSLFRTEAQELRARWAAQEKEKEEREKRQHDRELNHKTTGSSGSGSGFGAGFGFGSMAARATGGYYDRRKESVGTNTSSTGTSSEVQTPVGFGGGVVRESLYMSEGESAYGYGSSSGTSRKRRGRTKSMIAREREREEHEMARAAAEAAARKKWEKAQQLRDEMEEEERKREEYEEAARRRAAERLRREQIRRAEEERERLEAEAKKKAQQERRIEEARKAEERRREFQRREDEARLREEERKQRATEERAKRMREIQERFDKLRETSDVLLTGFLTVQAGNTVVWRRRYFQLMGDRMTLHRNAEETFKILENIDLNGTIKAIKEWEQGYDELRAIPHSWAIEFTNDAPWQFYADSEEDKDVLISLLTQVSISSAW